MGIYGTTETRKFPRKTASLFEVMQTLSVLGRETEIKFIFNKLCNDRNFFESESQKYLGNFQFKSADSFKFRCIVIHDFLIPRYIF